MKKILPLILTGLALIAFVTPSPHKRSPTPTPKPTVTATKPTRTPATIPKGVFSMTTGGGSHPIQPTTLSNPDVDGISIGAKWWIVEPREGEYDFTFIDSQLSRIEAAGKQCLLRVATGGPKSDAGGRKPAWVLDAVGSAVFSYIDPNPYHGTSGDIITIPLFWDQTFLDKKKAMITALGAHYAGNPTVKIFATNFANAFTEDWAVPSDNTVDGIPPTDSTQVSRLIAAGYTHTKMVDAGVQIIDAAMKAFPNQVVYVSMGGVKSTILEPKGRDALALDVIAAVRAKWGNRLVIGHNGFSAKSGLSQIQQNNLPASGQALWFCYQDTTHRMNGGSNPNNLTDDQIMRATFDKAAGVNWLEVYERDVKSLPGAITYGHNLLAK